ncbi:MAG: sigma-70 family RNA polymerase sigma factor [Clostridiales bacterium]|nr:sigma-70 family RNA polymerase sigma factor [Clostridiales bacterium]
MEIVETVETAALLDTRAVSAKEIKDEMEGLIEEFSPFMHSRVAKYSMRTDYDRREELFSTALMAFYEAIQRYEIEKGHFFPFANRVVCTRIIDHIRKIYRHEGQTVSLDEDASEQPTAQSTAVEEISVRAYTADRRQEMLVEEIEQFKSELATWGITMDSLAKSSPKHKQLLDEYRMAVAKIHQAPDIVQTIQLKRYFPVKTIAEITGLPQKKLERARTFILASLIIKMGDYDLLSDYVHDRR